MIPNYFCVSNATSVRSGLWLLLHHMTSEPQTHIMKFPFFSGELLLEIVTLSKIMLAVCENLSVSWRGTGV